MTMKIEWTKGQDKGADGCAYWHSDSRVYTRDEKGREVGGYATVERNRYADGKTDRFYLSVRATRDGKPFGAIPRQTKFDTLEAAMAAAPRALDAQRKWYEKKFGAVTINPTKENAVTTKTDSKKTTHAAKPTTSKKETAVKTTSKKTAAKKAPAKKATPAAPAKKAGPSLGREGSISHLFRTMILGGKTNDEVLKAARRAFPKAKIGDGYATWYRAQMIRAGFPESKCHAPA